MPEIVLTSAEVDALFGLIYQLSDLPVRAGGQQAASVACPVGLTFDYARPTRGSVGKPIAARSDKPDIGTEIARLQDALVRWDARGELPPAAPPTRIQAILAAADEAELEAAFLGNFCRHFGADYAGRYQVLVGRATELGVYPAIACSALATGTAEQPLGDAYDNSGVKTVERPLLQAVGLFVDYGFEGNTSDIALVDELQVASEDTLPKPPPAADDPESMGEAFPSPAVDEPHPRIIVDRPEGASWVARSGEAEKPPTPVPPTSRTTARRVQPTDGGRPRPGPWRILKSRR